MKENPLVSIMMPTNNRERFILDAICSIINQTYNNWELLILDDFSEDKTEETVKLVADFDSRIKYFKNKKHLGTPECRNKLLHLAKGELIGHLDDDDILHEKAIEKTVNIFTVNPTIALVYSDFIVIDENKKIIKKDVGIDFSKDNLVYLGFRPFTLYKKSVAIKVGGFNKNVYCEDGDLFMKIAYKYECRRVPEFLYAYRSHRTNFGHKRPACKDCDKQRTCNYFKIWTKEYKKFAEKKK